MVYCGKPSRGCENCRKVHKKCDENQPQCSRCLRMKRTCSGYQNQLDLTFRNETTRTQEKFHRGQSRMHGLSTRSARNSALFPAHGAVVPTWIHPGCMTRTHTLSPPAEDIVICHFYHSTLANLSGQDPARDLHAQLPGLYVKSNPGSALRLATEAISYAASTKLARGSARVSRKRYVQAIRAVRTAPQDVREAGDDQTLYAVLLLCGYETIMWSAHAPPAWGAHVDGAAALVKLRDKSNFHVPLSRGLFCFVRRSVVLSHMQSSRPVDRIFTLPNGAASSHDSPEDQLTAMAAKIPGIQYFTNSRLVQDLATSESDIRKLVHYAGRLDYDLSSWARNIPATWLYAAASDVSIPARSEFTPAQIHRYPDTYTARVWNFYRVSRLIIQSVLLRTIRRLPAPMESYQAEPNWKDIERRSVELVDDICASVPFLLGRDLSMMKLPTATGKEPGMTGRARCLDDGKDSGSRHAGMYSLLWPLHAASSTPSIPEAQRVWMRLQLRLVTEQGEAQARCLCHTESQVLLGGTEEFGFDCV